VAAAQALGVSTFPAFAEAPYPTPINSRYRSEWPTASSWNNGDLNAAYEDTRGSELVDLCEGTVPEGAEDLIRPEMELLTMEEGRYIAGEPLSLMVTGLTSTELSGMRMFFREIGRPNLMDPKNPGVMDHAWAEIDTPSFESMTDLLFTAELEFAPLLQEALSEDRNYQRTIQLYGITQSGKTIRASVKVETEQLVQ